MNDYEESIDAIGNTIEEYSSNKRYPVWGFGAKFPGAQTLTPGLLRNLEVLHIFQCDPNDQAVKGAAGVLDAYRTRLESGLVMSGPTDIREVLNAAAARSKKFLQTPLSSELKVQYCVLLILTDGIVHNLAETKELVRRYNEFQLPLSVVVVGIGRADFSEFHAWNAEPLERRGRFKFVEFRQHQYDPDSLSREALLNVPRETVDYLLSRNIYPAKFET